MSYLDSFLRSAPIKALTTTPSPGLGIIPTTTKITTPTTTTTSPLATTTSSSPSSSNYMDIYDTTNWGAMDEDGLRTTDDGRQFNTKTGTFLSTPDSTYLSDDPAFNTLGGQTFVPTNIIYNSGTNIPSTATWTNTTNPSVSTTVGPGTTSSGTLASTTTTSPTSFVPSPQVNKLSSPVAPMSVLPPTYDQRIRDQYMDTFTDPNMFWDEYSQGQGTQFTNQAARGMAKAGRTGMLPALTSLAHQDYMSNYLPSVRKDMAPGLSYENNWNQNLNQQYGQELDFSKNIYSSDITKFGQELDYEKSYNQLQVQIKDIEVKRELGLLDAEIKRLDINEDTRAHIIGNLLAVMPELSEQEQKLLLQDIGLIIGSENFGAAALQDTISNTERTWHNTIDESYNVGGG